MTQPLKSFLTSASFDFALAHISNFYDTDFFPRTEEFIAIAQYWDEVKEHLLNSSLDQVLSAAPLVEPWPKAKGGYRVVHRLEPLDALIYTALAKVVLLDVEKSRVSPEIACSYRFSDGSDSFFGQGSGFDMFRARCEVLAANHPYVLCTDISDFYNKIYLHRLQNALQLATDAPQGISKRVEQFLTALNTKASQGIPVGPAASIVMSEATLNDVDKFLYEKGIEHVRYVDDFRIFGSSRSQLLALLQSLTIYLHENQRLALNSEKTHIVESPEFLAQEINNHYTQQKLQILDDIESVDPYTVGTHNDIHDDLPHSNNVGSILREALNKVLEYETLDLGLVRAIVRRAKANKTTEIFEPLLRKLSFVAPAINDVVLYFDAISSEDFLKDSIEQFAKACDSSAIHTRIVRLWLEWYFSRHPILLSNAKIRGFVFSSERLRPQALAAIALRSEAWIKDRKTKVLHYAHWDRRSIILAASLLARDEREKWLLPMVKGDSFSVLEKWMARWVLDGSPTDVDPFNDPF